MLGRQIASNVTIILCNYVIASLKSALRSLLQVTKYKNILNILIFSIYCIWSQSCNDIIMRAGRARHRQKNGSGCTVVARETRSITCSLGRASSSASTWARALHMPRSTHTGSMSPVVDYSYNNYRRLWKCVHCKTSVYSFHSIKVLVLSQIYGLRHQTYINYKGHTPYCCVR